MCVKAAKRMFNQLLRAILVKEYNFFNNTEGKKLFIIKIENIFVNYFINLLNLGKLMNIFNRDQGVVDDTLASTNFDFLQVKFIK